MQAHYLICDSGATVQTAVLIEYVTTNGSGQGYAAAVLAKLLENFPLFPSGTAGEQRIRAKVGDLRNRGQLPPTIEGAAVGDAASQDLFPAGCAEGKVGAWCKKYAEDNFVFQTADTTKSVPTFTSTADTVFAQRVFTEASSKKDVHVCLSKLALQLYNAISQLHTCQ